MTDATREHLLLTVLGVDPKLTTYVWGERTETAKVAPAALYAFLPETERPDRVLALCTAEARAESLPALTEGLGEACPVDPVEISFAPDEDAIHACLATLAEKIPAGVDLTVDVTHGPRHLSFPTYMGVLYLTALRGVRLRAAYYGMRDSGDVGWFVDVQPLVELPHWFHAVRMLKDTGSAHAVAGLVATSDGETASVMGAELRQLSEAYLSGLPIELGYLARRFLTEHGEPLRELLQMRRLPLADTLARELTDELDRQQLTQELTGSRWKAGATLDRDELARQVRVIDSFLARNDYATAFGLMREWLVLWTMWRLGIEAGWLDYYARKPAEEILRRITDRAERPGRWSRPLTDEQVTIGRVWGALHKLRNRYAHHGMDKHVTLSIDPGVEAHLETILWVWRNTLRGVPEFSLDLPPPERRLLVSPIGTRPGVLFSALHRANPAQVSSCLVICSAETERAVRPAVEAAGYHGEVIVLRFSDPFAGTHELDLRVKEAKQHVRDAEEVLVNVTGGTTLMGVLAERIAGKARGFGRAAHRFALVDRRPPAEQETDPYQVGEVCWLDDPPGEGGGA